MALTLTNPIFTAKVVSYERLALRPKGVWFREFELFSNNHDIEVWRDRESKELYNIRNIEIYDIVIDITKPDKPLTLPERVCKGCGKSIDGDRRVTICNGEYYCDYDCFCDHLENKE